MGDNVTHPNNFTLGGVYAMEWSLDSVTKSVASQ